MPHVHSLVLASLTSEVSAVGNSWLPGPGAVPSCLPAGLPQKVRAPATLPLGDSRALRGAEGTPAPVAEMALEVTLSSSIGCE